ncbi:hypothetical protein IFM89_004591 [Coptis chinensis]|uniref:UDP-glycosyltransferases domain-containing protein n=1 Tax=Coptis chinensis TaxID=261450 RepID=A0A835H4J0_9MAGN|nr:hypothetical protein IFM89_004591 [Coptis chinensis]
MDEKRSWREYLRGDLGMGIGKLQSRNGFPFFFSYIFFREAKRCLLNDEYTLQLKTGLRISWVKLSAKAAIWILCNSFRDLEPANNDFIPNILSIGPLLVSERLGYPNGHLQQEDSTCLAWLDQQPVQSVVYLAFGSTTTFNQSQFSELVHGLELVDRPFLWVVRPDLTDELSPLHSDSFKGIIAQHGKIVDWAPQQKVLAHPSIACFVTHCGWNSTVDGVTMGVPLLCWPYVADQFHNRTYICDIWKVGLRLEQGENGIVTRSEIRTKVHELLGDEGIRTRANKLRDMAKKSVSEGGSSTKNFQDFINWIKSKRYLMKLMIVVKVLSRTH